MAYPFTDTPKIGVDLNNLHDTSDIGEYAGSSHRLGSQVWGVDARRYIYAEAGASITSGATTVSIDPETFIATGTGGTYTAPGQDMVAGNRGWFAAGEPAEG